ncbi:MAG TPA: hypothetical protein PLW68_10190, partial [Casimicrobiaceae bacterium]|nr:hypothetical protein [Casimicrobiaceae bacterium]
AGPGIDRWPSIRPPRLFALESSSRVLRRVGFQGFTGLHGNHVDGHRPILDESFGPPVSLSDTAACIACE